MPLPGSLESSGKMDGNASLSKLHFPANAGPYQISLCERACTLCMLAILAKSRMFSVGFIYG